MSRLSSFLSRWRTAPTLITNRAVSVDPLLFTADTASIASSPGASPSHATFSPPSPDSASIPSPSACDPVLVESSSSSSVAPDDASTASSASSVSSPPLLKRIGMFGSVSLLFNNVTGGGMVLFAQLYQQAGWLLPTLTLCLLGGLTLISSLMLVSCMSLMPGNSGFTQRVEYSSVMRHYLSRPLYLLSFCCYQLSLLSSNISLIVQSVQVADFAVAALPPYHRSCLLPAVAPPAFISCPQPVYGGIQVFPAGSYGLSLGFLLTALAVIPLALFNLDDNIRVQQAACLSLLAICAVWAALFADHGLHADYVPAVGSSFSPILGICLFNFAFLTSLPSWVNEKRETVSIGRAVSVSLVLSVLAFVATGLLCGLSFTPWTDASTLLDRVYELTAPLARPTFYCFPIVANLTSIPVTSIFQKQNLTSQGVPRGWSVAIAVVLPWLISLFLLWGDGYEQLAQWSGILITSSVNFILPPAVYIVAIRRRDREQREEMERRLLQAEAASEVEVMGSEDGDVTAADAAAAVFEVLPASWRRWQLPLSVGVLLLMSAACLLTLAISCVQV